MKWELRTENWELGTENWELLGDGGWGVGVGEGAMRGLFTDQVISGQMKGFKINHIWRKGGGEVRSKLDKRGIYYPIRSLASKTYELSR